MDGWDEIPMSHITEHATEQLAIKEAGRALKKGEGSHAWVYPMYKDPLKRWMCKVSHDFGLQPAFTGAALRRQVRTFTR
jgi:hypothetical protein